jgi:hypothetical protein
MRPKPWALWVSKTRTKRIINFHSVNNICYGLVIEFLQWRCLAVDSNLYCCGLMILFSTAKINNACYLTRATKHLDK